MGKQWKQWETLFSWAPKPLQMMTIAIKLRHFLFGRKAMTNLVVGLVAKSCPTCDPMDCKLPSSSVHRVLQARILEWVAISFSRGSSWPRDQTWSPALQTDYLPTEPWGKPMTNLDSILKSKDITLLTKVHLVKAMGFPNSSVESWAPKNWCFWTECWRRLLRVPWMLGDQTSQS